MVSEDCQVTPAPEFPYAAHRFQVLIGVGEFTIVYYNMIGGKCVEPVGLDAHEHVFYSIPERGMAVAA